MSLMHPLHLNRVQPNKIEPANPAAGANINITVPNRQWTLLTSLKFRLTTDGTAVNRRVILFATSGADIVWALPCPDVQGATSVADYFFWIGHGTPLPAIYDNIWSGPLPSRNLLEGPESFLTSIVNLQAADQISNVYGRSEIWHDTVDLTP
jgi:hypothetical protein